MELNPNLTREGTGAQLFGSHFRIPPRSPLITDSLQNSQESRLIGQNQPGAKPHFFAEHGGIHIPKQSSNINRMPHRLSGHKLLTVCFFFWGGGGLCLFHHFLSIKTLNLIRSPSSSSSVNTQSWTRLARPFTTTVTYTNPMVVAFSTQNVHVMFFERRFYVQLLAPGRECRALDLRPPR